MVSDAILQNMIQHTFDELYPKRREQSDWTNEEDAFLLQQAGAYLSSHVLSPHKDAVQILELLKDYLRGEFLAVFESHAFLQGSAFAWSQPFSNLSYQAGCLPQGLSLNRLCIRLTRREDDNRFLDMKTPYLPKTEDHRLPAIDLTAGKAILLEDLYDYSDDAKSFQKNLEELIRGRLIQVFAIQQNISSKLLVPNHLDELEELFQRPLGFHNLVEMNLLKEPGFLSTKASTFVVVADGEGNMLTDTPLMNDAFLKNSSKFFLFFHAVLPMILAEDGCRLTKTIPLPLAGVPLPRIQELAQEGALTDFLHQSICYVVSYCHEVVTACQNPGT